MSRYYLGVDIGGTKSHAMVGDDTGRILGFSEGGAGNYETVGYSGLKATLKSITKNALDQAGIGVKQITGAGFGVAGYDWPSELAPTLKSIEILRLKAPIEVVNDTVIGLLAGASQGWGVAVVAGTSNNCRGRDQYGREGRVTGNGPNFGEYGGASELVAKAVQAVAAEWSCRGPKTELTRMFLKLTDAENSGSLIEGLVLGQIELSAQAAPLIFQIAQDGDPVAVDLIRWAGCELGSLVVGVIRQLNFEALSFEVVMVGSMFSGGALLTDPLLETIKTAAPCARLVRLSVPPVIGAVLLGMEAAGIDIVRYREPLFQSWEMFKP